MTSRKALRAEVESLNLKYNEMCGIADFCTNPPGHINNVVKTDERLILTNNGTPVVGIVPLWMLAVMKEYTTKLCVGVSVSHVENNVENKIENKE